MNGERKEKRNKRKGDVAHGAALFFSLFTLLFSLLLSGCGFHLRGTGKSEMPPQLATMRVAVSDSKLANDPLWVAVREALRTQGGVRVEEAGDAPLLVLSGERTESQVQSVGATTGRASGFLLRYEVTFHLVGADAKELAASQTIKLQRDYTYDPLNVLAKEREEQELKREMQRDAVQQIVRRLSKTKL